ncbi:MAG: hypothetical protein MZU84_05880 [Sphingobacterium sp.]|nr:hypothetical protein [Sphingobacterium sp.]
MRDPYTAGHQERVTRLARAIAVEMGLAEERVEAIEIAGDHPRRRQALRPGRDPEQADQADRSRVRHDQDARPGRATPS